MSFVSDGWVGAAGPAGLDDRSGWTQQLRLCLDCVRCIGRASSSADGAATAGLCGCAGDVYAATINDSIAIKIGRGDWSPNMAKIEAKGSQGWNKACNGHNWACWEVGAK